MSERQSGVYKSRIFKIASRQYQFVADKLNLALRRVKVVASWGLQLIFSPIYLIFKQDQLKGGQSVQEKLEMSKGELENIKEELSLTVGETGENEHNLPLIIDINQPIEKILLAATQTLEVGAIAANLNPLTWGPNRTASDHVENLWRAVDYVRSFLPHNELDIHPDPSLQGIASSLSNHNLVLVTNDNQILDILATWQQWQLQQRINWELANFDKHQQILTQESQGKTILKSLPTQVENIINLVQKESKFIGDMLTNKNLGNSSEEDTKLKSIPTQVEKIVKLVGKESKLIGEILLNNYRADRPENLNESEFLINEQELPWLTKEQLFNRQDNVELIADKISKNKIHDRLFGIIRESENLEANNQEDLPKSAQKDETSFNEVISNYLPNPKIKQSLNSANVSVSSHHAEVTDIKLVNTQKYQGINPSNQGKSINQDIIHKTTIHTSPDQEQESSEYLETQGIHSGYVYHPLEKLLALIDSIMVFLETLALTLWEWWKEKRAKNN